MNYKKIVGWTLLCLGIFFLIIIAGFFFNSKTKVCEGKDFYDNSTTTCYYFSTVCVGSATPKLLNGQEICSYPPSTYFQQKTLKSLLILSGVFLFIFMIIFLYFYFFYDDTNLSGFKKEDFVFPDRAIEVWKLSWAKKTGIPVINDKYSDDAFQVDTACEPTMKGREHFLKFQVEVKEGKQQGLFTVILSLSRGEDWIRNGYYSYQEVHYYDYKRPRDWALYTPESAQERVLEQLAQTNPDKALELEEQMLQKSLETPTEPEPQQQDVMIQPYRRPAYRRPYPRRRMY